jgi:hypothetical protein
MFKDLMLGNSNCRQRQVNDLAPGLEPAAIEFLAAIGAELIGMIDYPVGDISFPAEVNGSFPSLLFGFFLDIGLKVQGWAGGSLLMELFQLLAEAGASCCRSWLFSSRS